MFGDAANRAGGADRARLRSVSSGPGSIILELRGASTRAAGSETALRDIDSLGSRRGNRRRGRRFRQRPEGAGRPDPRPSVPRPRGEAVPGRRRHGVVDRPHAEERGRLRSRGPAGHGCRPGMMSVRENLVLGTGRRYAHGAGGGLAAPRCGHGRTRSRGSDFPLPALSGPHPRPVRRESPAGGRSRARWRTIRGWSSPCTRRAAWTSGAPPRCEICFEGPARSGAGVLLISEDLEELAEMSDRLLVMYGGAHRRRVRARRMERGGRRPLDDGFEPRGRGRSMSALEGTTAAVRRVVVPHAAPPSATSSSSSSRWRSSRVILLAAGKDPFKAYADTFSLHACQRLRILGARWCA